MVRLLEENVVVKQQDLLTVLRNFFLAIGKSKLVKCVLERDTAKVRPRHHACSVAVNWDTSVVMGFQPDDLEDGVISAHLAAFPVVFLDGTGYWNIANGISKDSLLLVGSYT